MNEILNLILITLLPFLELRASIPYGILKAGLDWPVVFFVCVITNAILGLVIYYFIEKIIKILTKIKIVNKIWGKYVERTQKIIHKTVEKYGEIAVAIFIAIPLPGSGVYSGAIAADLIGLDFKKFITAEIIGVLIAGMIVTIVTLTGAEAFQFLIKLI